MFLCGNANAQMFIQTFLPPEIILQFIKVHFESIKSESLGSLHRPWAIISFQEILKKVHEDVSTEIHLVHQEHLSYCACASL